MEVAARILNTVRSMGVEEMWEDHPDRSLSGIKSLARLLNADREVPYPADTYEGGYCDLVIPMGGGKTWIECKFAWTYTRDREPGKSNRNYRKHLLTCSQESAMKDVSVKLTSLLGRPEVERVGFLLVCFHSIQLPLPDADIEEFERVAELNADPWSRRSLDDWVNPRNPDCRIRAYCWERPARVSIMPMQTDRPSTGC